jgi:hypothetical protein
MRSTILFSLALVAFSLTIGGTGDGPLDRGTLRGLKAVGVIVDPPDPLLDSEGLTADVLRRQLEGRLRHGGINVDPGAVEFLGLRVSSVRTRKGPYTLCLSIGVYQPVSLTRDKEIHTATPTWQADTLMVAQPKLLMQSSTTALDQLADQFVAAWRSVNPQ